MSLPPGSRARPLSRVGRRSPGLSRVTTVTFRPFSVNETPWQLLLALCRPSSSPHLQFHTPLSSPPRPAFVTVCLPRVVRRRPFAAALQRPCCWPSSTLPSRRFPPKERSEAGTDRVGGQGGGGAVAAPSASWRSSVAGKPCARQGSGGAPLSRPPPYWTGGWVHWRGGGTLPLPRPPRVVV